MRFSRRINSCHSAFVETSQDSRSGHSQVTRRTTLGRVDELGRRLASLDERTSALEEEKLGVIVARKKLVDEVEVKTQMITNLLADVRVNLETLGEQKSVVDHISEKLARLDFVTREAEHPRIAAARARAD